MMFKRKRKTLILILVMTMMFASMVFADNSNGDYEISSEVSFTGNIEEGDTILYKLTVKNVSGTNLSDIKAYVSGSFSLATGSSLTIGDLNDGVVSAQFSLPLTYSGSGNKLNVLVDDGSGHSIIDNLSIGSVIETNNSTPQPVDKDRLYPEFNMLLADSVPVFTAGSEKLFEFELENITTYYGKNVWVSFEHSDDFPFDDSVNPLKTSTKNFSNKEKKTMEISVKTRSNVAPGFYTIPVKIHAENVYGLEKTYDKTIQIEVNSSKRHPNFIVEEVLQGTPKLVPGSEDLFQVTFKNLGTMQAKNIKVELEGLEMNGISLNADTSSKTIRIVDAGKTDFVYYKINVSDALEVSKKELTVKLSYNDAFGEVYEQTLPVYLDIDNGSVSLYDVDVQVTQSPKSIQPTDEFTVKFDVTNQTGQPQENLKLKFSSDGGFINKSDAVIVIDTLAADTTASDYFTLIAPNGMASNNYPSYIIVEDNKGNTEEHYLGLYVDGESSANSKPKIIIDDYDYGEGSVLAGDTFDLSITFFNTSNTMGIQNAKVSIASEEGAFVPVNSASSFYIESIGIKEKVTHTITMKAKADLSVKTYNVTTDIEYEDSNGNSYDKNNNPYTANESIAIPVMQELRLEIEEVTVNPFMNVYQPSEVFVEFFNMGKSTLYNMMVKTEGDFDVQDGKYFIGDFNPGSNDYYSCNIIPLVEGAQSGKVIFEFEDAVGEKHVIEKTFDFEAMEMQEPVMEGPGGMDEGFNEYPPMEEETSQSSIGKFIVIGIVILIAGTIAIVVRKKIKRKKEMMFDE